MKKAATKKPCNCIEQCNAELRPMGFVLDTAMQIDFVTGKSTLCLPMAIRKIGATRKKPPTFLGNYCPVCGKKTAVK